MHRTTTAVGARDVGARLREQARLNPEWEGWLGLLELVYRSLEDPVWAAVEPELSGERPENAPLLHGARLELDARPVRRWLRRLVKRAAAGDAVEAASLRSLKSRQLDALVVLQAAVRQDEERLAAIAAEAGVSAGALGAVAQVAVLPLLHGCAHRLRDRLPAVWLHGYCPLCGAWPSLAELRGLERKRVLRCGRCAAEWQWSVLHCPYCGERDHRRLPSLVPEGEEEVRRVDACDGCRAYVKAVATVAAIPARELPLRDLESVELELAALERGYQRPQGAGHALDVTLAEPERRWLPAFVG